MGLRNVTVTWSPAATLVAQNSLRMRDWLLPAAPPHPGRLLYAMSAVSER